MTALQFLISTGGSRFLFRRSRTRSSQGSGEAVTRYFFALVFALSVTPATGQVYKWVDEKGHVQYGDKPPPGANASALEPPPERQGTGFRIVELFVRADPFDYSGPCPVTIVFSARISAVGGSGTVSYRWQRSDRASPPIESLAFNSPGSRDIKTTWQVGGKGLSFSGWEAIETFEPTSGSSNHAEFNIRCSP